MTSGLRPRHPLALVLAVFALAAATPACIAEEADADEDGTAADAVRNGSVTLDNPEIGAFWRGGTLCTGTLIRSDVVLTAAHCVPGSGSDDLANASPAWEFRITTGDRAQHVYKVDRARSLLRDTDRAGGGDSWRPADLALLHLAERVPSSVARPVALATSWALPGQLVAVYGYGCTKLGTRDGTGTKRKHEFTWSAGQFLGLTTSQDLCPGDSGGPLFKVGSRAVMGVNSGSTPTRDYFGNVPQFRDRIDGVLLEWR